LGKSKKQACSPSTRVSLFPLEVIHTDILTSPVLSISGHTYYIAFVDDFSRFTWIYPLHTKSEAYNAFLKFKLLVENQFSISIKEIQSDGRGEYTSHLFQTFLKYNIIEHRKSCPYTSLQNGLAERKLRHILETGLTLLAHSHLSNKYWVDSFLTAVFVINKLPTPTLQNMSLDSKLYSKASDYQRLRVFGCLCYSLLRPYNAHKLEYRSKPCIFLGYNCAGYKFLDPVTNKADLSRYVVFDETSSLAKDLVAAHFLSKLHSQGDTPFPLPILSIFNTNPCQSLTEGTPSATQPTHIAKSSPTTSEPTMSHEEPTISAATHVTQPSHPMLTRSRSHILLNPPSLEQPSSTSVE
jgi:hypothetical protein